MPAVAVPELVGAEPERPAEQLVAEADPEERQALGAGRPAAARLRPVGGRRVARPVGEEHAVGVRRRARPSRVAVAGSTCTSMPRSAIRCGVMALMPEVDGGDGEAVSRRRPARRRARRSRPRRRGRRRPSAGPRGPRPRGPRRARRRPVPRRARPHRAALAQVPGEGAGVDAADADDALVAQLVVELAARAPARRAARGVAHDVAGDPDRRGLGVLVVDAGVADVRGGHHDDLPVVRRVGQRLLVAGHAGGEDGLAERLADGAVRLAAEGRPSSRTSTARCSWTLAAPFTPRLPQPRGRGVPRPGRAGRRPLRTPA